MNFKKFLILATLFFLGGSFLMYGQSKKVDSESTLIAREILFDNPEITGADLSPDGHYITFMKAYKGILNIWIKKIDEPFEKARLLTDSNSPLEIGRAHV